MRILAARVAIGALMVLAMGPTGATGQRSPARTWDGRRADLRSLVSAVGRPALVGGYSFGAEVVPEVLRTWPAAQRSAIDGLVLVAPGPSASFEIDPLDWLRTPPEDPAMRVAPTVQELRLPTLCVMGEDDTESACRGLANVPAFRVARLPGSHHFDGNYAAVGDTITRFIQEVAGRDRGPGTRLRFGLPSRSSPEASEGWTPDDK